MAQVTPSCACFIQLGRLCQPLSERTIILMLLER